MLNIFPELLSYSLVAPFILRLVLGLLTIDLGYLKFKGEKENWILALETFKIKPAKIWVTFLGVIQIIGGLFLLIGLYTQVVALIFSFITLAELYIEYREPEILKRNIVFYILLLAISTSLLFSGAGFFAIDFSL